MQFLTCNLDTVGKKIKLKLKGLKSNYERNEKKKKKTQEKQLLKK